MKRDLITLALILAGALALCSARAEENNFPLLTSTSSDDTTSGYVQTSATIPEPAVTESRPDFHKAALPEPSSLGLLAVSGIAFATLKARRRAK